jgi:hypothetical protein
MSITGHHGHEGHHELTSHPRHYEHHRPQTLTRSWTTHPSSSRTPRKSLGHGYQRHHRGIYMYYRVGSIEPTAVVLPSLMEFLPRHRRTGMGRYTSP